MPLRTTLTFRFRKQFQSSTDKTWLFWDESPNASYHSVSLIKVSASAIIEPRRALAHEETYLPGGLESPQRFRTALAELDPATYDVLQSALQNQVSDLIVKLTDWGDPTWVGPWSIELKLSPESALASVSS